MKKLIHLIIILAVIGVGAFMYFNHYDKDDMYAIAMPIIKENIGKNAVMVDVRTVEEYDASHAVDAINIPLSDIQKGSEPDVPKEGIVYVYCKSGVRAGQAKTILEKVGFKHVINLTSLDNWKALGGKVTVSQSE
ncbi:MAG: rhodanese-like domain-containing protein [Candidatus Saccharimonadaceae bacterium]|nr:rhodanese-like domain-containing protein [Candidatus Saccharimonadaceae bacterium]